MPLIAFDEMPDDARLWVFAANRPLTREESAMLLAATDAFLEDWTAHKVPLATAREWRHDQFLFVAVDEAAAGASGCSIDALVHLMRETEQRLDARLTDNGPVWFREPDGTVACTRRHEFAQMAERGAVGPETVVFDNAITTVRALRGGLWEVPARQAWHGRAFFSGDAIPSK